MRVMLRYNAVFLGLWACLCLLMGIAICAVDKGTLHLELCDHHTAFLDTLMPVLSDLVNWLPYALGVVLLVWKWRVGVFVSGSLLLSTGFVQALKHIVRAPRPLTWFAENMPDVSLPLTEGVKMNHYLSFPSGHTTTYFCMALALCAVCTYYLEKWKGTEKTTPSNERKVLPTVVSITVQVLLFLVAAICSYSRIYLSQHFALDVLAGMILGVLSVFVAGAICLHVGKTPIISVTPK